MILNDNNTPYYLTDNFQGIRSNYIYTRIQDTNTPIDRSADLDKVELLWKKRFGLTQSVLERLEIYLEDYENWIDGPYGEMQKYYNIFLSLQITMILIIRRMLLSTICFHNVIKHQVG